MAQTKQYAGAAIKRAADERIARQKPKRVWTGKDLADEIKAQGLWPKFKGENFLCYIDKYSGKVATTNLPRIEGKLQDEFSSLSTDNTETAAKVRSACNNMSREKRQKLYDKGAEIVNSAPSNVPVPENAKWAPPVGSMGFQQALAYLRKTKLPTLSEWSLRHEVRYYPERFGVVRRNGIKLRGRGGRFVFNKAGLDAWEPFQQVTKETK